jgi:hypothetical protein
MIEVCSSHGEIYLDELGYVAKKNIWCRSDCDKCIDNIERFDLVEHRRYYQADYEFIDILDVGGWDFKGSYFPPDHAFRENTKSDD